MPQDEAIRSPVKYTVLEKSLIGNKIYEAGETVEYAGLPAENLAPQDDEGHARYQEFCKANEERQKGVQVQLADAGGKGISDPEAFAAAVRAAVAEANTGQAEMISAAVATAIAQVFPNGTAKKAVAPEAPSPPAAPADPETPLA